MKMFGFKAELYFLSYVLLTSFLLVNIAIAVLLENMFSAKEDQDLDSEDALYAYCTIKDCKYLPAVDLTGSSDPYVEVRFIFPADLRGTRPNDEVFNTEVFKTNRFPVWDAQFQVKGTPEKVVVTACDKDFGVKGHLMQNLRLVGNMFGAQKLGYGHGVNAAGDEILGIQQRTFGRLFSLLEGKEVIGNHNEELEFTLPLLAKLPQGQDAKPEYVYYEDSPDSETGQPIHSTITLAIGVGRHLFTQDTTQILAAMDKLQKEIISGVQDDNRKSAKAPRQQSDEVILSTVDDYPDIGTPAEKNGPTPANRTLINGAPTPAPLIPMPPFEITHQHTIAAAYQSLLRENKLLRSQLATKDAKLARMRDILGSDL